MPDVQQLFVLDAAFREICGESAEKVFCTEVVEYFSAVACLVLHHLDGSFAKNVITNS